MSNPIMTPEKITTGKGGTAVTFEWLLFRIYQDTNKRLSFPKVEDADE